MMVSMYLAVFLLLLIRLGDLLDYCCPVRIASESEKVTKVFEQLEGSV